MYRGGLSVCDSFVDLRRELGLRFWLRLWFGLGLGLGFWLWFRLRGEKSKRDILDLVTTVPTSEVIFNARWGFHVHGASKALSHPLLAG